MKLLPIMALPLLALSGCSGMSYAMQNYNDVPVIDWHDVETKEDFRFFDKPAENRLMITRSIGGAIIGGAFGPVGTMPEVLYEQAALRWLASTGRTCVATRTFLVVEPQYEVQYDCSGKAPAALPPAVPSGADKGM